MKGRVSAAAVELVSDSTRRISKAFGLDLSAAVLLVSNDATRIEERQVKSRILGVERMPALEFMGEYQSG